MRHKDYSISFARLVATCLIVACHVMQGRGIDLAFHLNIGVQVFLVISGWLHYGIKIEDPIAFLKKRAFRILVPYYLLILIVVPLYVWGAGVDLSLRDVRGLFLLRSQPHGLGHLWFVGNILFLYFITPYLSWLSAWMSRGSVWRFCFLSVLAFGFVFVIGLEYHEVVHPAIVMCYLAGYFSRAFKDKYGEVAHVVFSELSIILCVLILALRIGAEINLDIKCAIYNASLPFLKCAEGVGLFFLLKAIGAWFGRLKGLELTDKYSYEIYLCHHIFLIGPLALPLTGGGGRHCPCPDCSFSCGT